MNEVRRMAVNTVLHNMRSGFYKMEKINCPVCNGQEFKPVAEKDMYGLPISAVMCLHCQLIFNNPRLDEESLNHFYKNEYRQMDRGRLKPEEDFFELEKNKGRNIFEFLKKNGIELNEGVVIEIGCGMGGVLQFFKEKGFETVGCDLGEEYIDYGIKNHGLNLYTGNAKNLVQKLGGQTSKIKLVIYEQTLEHISDLKKELAEVRKIMNEDALLYIGVPGLRNIRDHYKSNFGRYLQLPHLTHFELASLQNLMAANGFEFVSGDETIRAVFKKGSGDKQDFKKTGVLNFLNTLKKERQKIVLKEKVNRILSLPKKIYKKII